MSFFISITKGDIRRSLREMKNSNLESFPTHSISYSFGLSVQDMNTARAGDKDITVCIHRKAYISSERGKNTIR